MATGQTPQYLIPYPLATDLVNVHGDMELLAEQLEDVLVTKADLYEANIFTDTNTFNVTSSNPAIAITQLGTGDAIRIWDDSTDSTPFVINYEGNIGIGTDAVSTSKLLIHGDDPTHDIFAIFGADEQVGDLSQWYDFGGTTPLVSISAAGVLSAISFISGPNGLEINGTTSGSTTIQTELEATGILTLPSATDTLVGKATTDIFTNKTFDTADTGNLFYVDENQIDAYTGTGSIVVLSTSPNISTSVTTDSVSFDLINTTATTVNFAGDAETLSIAASTGTTTINNSLVVEGDLTVNGTTTILNTEEITLQDPVIILNDGFTGDPTDTDLITGGNQYLLSGFTINRGTEDDVSLFWDEELLNWKITKDGTNFYNLLTKDADDEEWLQDNVVVPLLDHANHIGVVVTYDDVTNELILESAGGGGGTGSASLSDIWYLGA